MEGAKSLSRWLGPTVCPLSQEDEELSGRPAGGQEGVCWDSVLCKGRGGELQREGEWEDPGGALDC